MSYAVYIIDDDESVSESMKWFLEPLGFSVRIFGNGQAFLDEFQENGIEDTGCLIVDVRMPIMGGFELQRALIELGCDLPIIFLSGHGDIQQAVSAIKDGAEDFLQKPVNDQVLIDKINNSIRKHIAGRAKSECTIGLTEKFSSLTEREREVLRLVSEGNSSKLIARALDISYKTVEVHRGNIRKKLGLKSIAELTKAYYEYI